MSRQELRSKKAGEIREAFSARNRQIYSNLARDIFDAFGAGWTVRQLSQEYGLPVERIHGLLKDQQSQSHHQP